MQTFVVRRPGIAATATELGAALARMRAFEEKPHTLAAQWIRSYALCETDDRFGLACIFAADSAQTLAQHAGCVDLAASEILPVSATLPGRPFAPAKVYLIRRRGFWKTESELEQSAETARRIGDDEMARELSLLHTYAVSEADGTLGTVCLYQGVDADVLRGHAARAGMPADEVIPVLGRIVFRPDAQQHFLNRRVAESRSATLRPLSPLRESS
jgi:hypothetical protein